MKCRKCNKTVHECGGYLERVNEKGVPGIWECRPSCDAKLTNQEAILQAILGPEKIDLTEPPPDATVGT